MSIGMMWMCQSNVFLPAPNSFVMCTVITYVIHYVQPSILIFFLMTGRIHLSIVGNPGVDALVFFFCFLLLYLHITYMYLYMCISCPSTVSATEHVSQQSSDAQYTNMFNSCGAWTTDGGPLLLLAGPAPKTSSQAAAAVGTQTKPPFTSSTQLFIFRSIRGNTRQSLSDSNSRTSLLCYTQASSQLSLIFSNCFLSCLVE